MDSAQRVAAMPAAFSMRGITKRFSSTTANDRIDFECREGEIHALLGENGAGKSTLMNILYGLLRPDEGAIFVGDRHVEISSPRDALKLGIGMIHQHFMLIPSFTVIENVILGIPPCRGPFVDLAAAHDAVGSAAHKFGLTLDLAATVRNLSVSSQQKIEILRLLYRGARILILDEPTSVLAPHEVRELFAILRSLAAAGHSIVFITHKLEEAAEISDRVTVLRAGHVVSTQRTGEVTTRDLATEMVGRDLHDEPQIEGQYGTEVVLRMVDVRALDDRGLCALDGVDIEVHEGEILGVAGVDGNGQHELAQVLTGLRRIVAGRLELTGYDLSHAGPWDFISRGVAHVPEDRQTDGLVLDFSLAENLVLQTHGLPPFSKLGFIDSQAIRKHACQLLSDFDVRPPNPELRAGMLSGGNQQKVVLAREFSRRPTLIVACHPTRGLDIGSVEYVHERLVEERRRGCAIVLISQDLDELLCLCDRLAVVFRGKIVAVLPARDADVNEVGLMMTGVQSGIAAVNDLARTCDC